MRVLVTGAAGFVGRAVVRRLQLAGHQPVALVHQRRTLVPAGAELVNGDVLNLESMRRAVDGVDAVCHLAALTRGRESFTEPIRYFRVNLDGTLNLLDALAGQALTAPPRLVFASTCLVYGEPDQQPIAETTPTQPTSPYGASKVAAEAAIAAQAGTGALAATIIRTFNAAGAIDGITDEDETRIIPRTIAVAAGRADVLYVNGDGSVVREYVHVDDLANAIVMAMEATAAGECRTYNVGSSCGTSLREVIAAVETITGDRLPVEHRPPAREPHSLVSDSAKIRHELGWQPTRSDLDTIIQDAWSAETDRRYASAA